MSNRRESSVEGQGLEPGAPQPASWGGVWLVLLAIGAALVVLVKMQRERPQATGPYAGRPLPPLTATGWINTAQPLTAEDLQGKIVLVDFWATWCRPCVRGIPEVIKFHQRYREAGVVVVGLTAEDGAAAEQVKSFVESRDGMDWPVGYGARLPFQMLGIEGIPTYLLFDRTGQSIWGGHSLAGIDEALLPLLAKSE